MKTRYRFGVEYDGTNYSGWQIQPNAPTIQGEIEAALSTVTRQQISITGSGRTDAGVHARGQVAHVDIEGEVNPESLQRSVNGIIPNDIAIYDLRAVHPEFHARFDAVHREYLYFYNTTPLPLMRNTVSLYRYELDFNRMKEAVVHLNGEFDFRTFTPEDPELPHYRCTILESEIQDQGERTPGVFRIRANRFLRSVVRSLMGTLWEVGRGKISPDEFRNMLVEPDRNQAGKTAPATGLVLNKVVYPED